MIFQGSVWSSARKSLTISKVISIKTVENFWLISLYGIVFQSWLLKTIGLICWHLAFRGITKMCLHVVEGSETKFEKLFSWASTTLCLKFCFVKLCLTSIVFNMYAFNIYLKILIYVCNDYFINVFKEKHTIIITFKCISVDCLIFSWEINKYIWHPKTK